MRIIYLLGTAAALSACNPDLSVTTPQSGSRPEFTIGGPGSPALTSSVSPSIVFQFSAIPLSRANMINNAGVVVGDRGNNNVAASWTAAGGLHMIGDLNGSTTACCSTLNDVNATGKAIGLGNDAFAIAAMLWEQATDTKAGFHATGIGDNSRGQGINDAGDFAGHVDGGVPFYKAAGGPAVLLSKTPFTQAFVFGLNNANTAVGFAIRSDGIQRAVAWINPISPVSDLGSLGGNISRALAINEAGDIVGWSEITPGSAVRHAALWPATGGIVDLATWPGHCSGSSEAAGINNNGVIVGRCNGEAVLWSALEGMRALPNTWSTGDPRSINDNLEIVGMAPASFGGAMWKVVNHPPTAAPGGSYQGNEGTSVAFDGSGSIDLEGGALTYAWTFGDGGTATGVSPTHTYSDNGVFTVTLTVTDAMGASSDPVSTTALIANLPPAIVSLTLPTDPIPVGSLVSLSASFTDPSSIDTHSADVNWDDGAGTIAAAVDQGSRTVSATRTFAAPGVYTVTLAVMDDDGGSTNAVGTGYIVVYDPAGGFVTGGGWIASPAGACPISFCASGDAGGRATFGFVSRYRRGSTLPTGNTEFQYHSGQINFSSSSYQWLVVAGARAQFKGTGSINGTGSYGFLLTAIDGQLPGGGGIDRFRIKIWEIGSGVVVYDNQPGADEDSAATTELGGGSVTIHP